MGRLSTSLKERGGAKTRIFAYGFDAAGFDTQDESKELADGSKVEFLPFSDSRNLDLADGVIIPQGIFEKIETGKRSFMGSKTVVRVDKSSLLERERQVFNLLREGKWVCFLVGEIIDELPDGINSEPIHDTDLCKRLLNAFGVRRHHRYNLAFPEDITVRDSEFEFYFHHYGTPVTVLELPHVQPIERRVLIELARSGAVGVEFDRQLFFLPFCQSDKRGSTALSIVKTVTLAISEYRQKHVIKIPSWVDEISFKSEEGLYLEINSLLEKVNRLESELESWKDYKAILTSSGLTLANRVAAILESFFELKVDWMEETREKAIMKSEDGSNLAIFDAKSTEKEIERTWIDEFVSYRNSQGLPGCMPGVLFVNSDRSVREIDGRLKGTVPEDQVQYAKDRDVLIVRTIDLLFLMQHMENDSHRNKRLIHLLSSGGGWLKANAESYRVV